MALIPGTRLGVYEITAPIGEGGMGQVYRATDTTLDRQVAIKILPDAFASDPERMARFEREAKTLASLNHPHIAAIYAVEKSAGRERERSAAITTTRRRVTGARVSPAVTAQDFVAIAGLPPHGKRIRRKQIRRV